MKTECEACLRLLMPDGEAFICSYECTYCPDCAVRHGHVCPNCGGELVRRPRRGSCIPDDETNVEEGLPSIRSGLIWAASFGAWTLVALAATVTIYSLYRPMHNGLTLRTIAGMQFSEFLPFIPLTPYAFILAARYPIQRNNWTKRCFLHLGIGLVFTLGHIFLKSLTPYGYWDPTYREWSSAVWNSHVHTFRMPWVVFRSMFLGSVVDDVTSGYVPIMLIAHAIAYYRRFQRGELRASQLEAQLAKARLQTLKSQLQPHFLFNTMHSISALMLTDVQAADRMMSRLSDLLRISLENAGTQITTLSRELEFMNCYLEIEQVRFEERLNVVLDVAPETLDAQVPHLLLQPLVDNALKHGISKLPEGGEIRIAASTQESVLQLEVHDNGPGALCTGPFRTSGVGLRVTRERLESLYGQDQSFEFLSPPNGGATVRVCIPFRVQVESEPTAATKTA